MYGSNRIFSVIIILMFSIVNIESYAIEKYVTANLNLREGPSTEFSIISVIPKGTIVSINEDCDCKWILIEYNGMIGYISSKYLSSTPQYINVPSLQKKHISRSAEYDNSSNKNIKYYINSRGNKVQSPTYYSSKPAGATALCRDGTYSFSQSRRGTCSHHGGVAQWY